MLSPSAFTFYVFVSVVVAIFWLLDVRRSPLPAAAVSQSLAKHPPRVLDPHFVSDAGP
jgi:hypothetical protein